jgi:hypothetical protein
MAGYTTGQANPNLQQLTNIPAEYSGDAQDLARSQRLAQMLMSTETPQGQMVSGRYVAPSIFQNLAQLVNTGTGAYFQNQAEEKQTKLAEKLRSDKMVTQQGIMDAIDKGDTKKALAIASSRPEFAKEFITPLLGNVIPPASKPTSEIQNFEYMQSKGQLPKNMTLLQYQKALKDDGNKEKPPMGYRFMADGSLEPIKGGPADLKTQAKSAGAGDVSTEIVKLKDSYDKLYEGGGITDPSLKIGSNLMGKVSSSGIGQTIGSTFGTKNQTERDKISQTRPLLMGAIMKATGMSAKQIDSNAELKLWLSTATDPTKSYEANMAALQNIEDLYGVTALEKQVTAPNFDKKPANPANPAKPAANKAKTVVRTGEVQSGPNKGKKIVEFSDGTTEYR